ncbi:MAG TPA: extracellular solute-binding protein [Arachnia sp.]|jgi:iron(III) transport system substrate-binding protein|nr:extracellular solute-binding protein [Arachnia sp.]
MNLRKIIAGTSAGLLALGLAACGGGDSPEPGDTGGAAAPENNSLIFYSTMTENDLNVMTGLLEENFPGIEIEIVNGNAGELTTRIRSEAGNPQGDMMWGGLDTMDGDTYSDVFEHWLSDYEDTVLPQYQSPNGFYNVDHLSTVAFAVNTDIEKELGITVNGYADLLNPALKGKILMADPTSSSSAWNNLSNILTVFGKDTDAPWDYVSDLLKNDLVIASSSSAAFNSVADGEYAVGLTYEDGISVLIKNGVENIKMVYPAEGTSASAFATAVIKGGPNPELAKKVVNYIMSPEGQVAFGEGVGTVRMTTSETVNSEWLPPREEITWVDRDVAWLTENRPAAIERWTEIYTELRGS